MDHFDADRAALVITSAYAVAFALLIVARQRTPEARERLFWALAALAILALGINKPLDLQTDLTAWGRQLARDGGWYTHRRQVQVAFIAGLAVATAIAALGFGWLVRRMGGPVWLALTGLIVLAGFVLLRAASFHHVDGLLRTRLFGTRAWVVIELGGILVVALGALWSVLRRPAALSPRRLS